MEALLVPREAHGKRVDLFISANAPDHISRARVQSLVRQGHVTINGVVPKGTSVKIAEDDVVRFVMPEAEEAIPQPEDIPCAYRGRNLQPRLGRVCSACTQYDVESRWH